MSVTKKLYGKMNGKEVYAFTVENKNGMKAQLLEKGATLDKLFVKDKNGKFIDVLVGFDTLEDHLTQGDYQGVIVGQYANRIKDGKFTIDGTQATVEACDVEIISEDIPGWLVANEGNLTAALDITVTEELRREGIAREIVNRIQNIRKDNDFDITDRIKVVISKNENSDAAITEYTDYISKQVLADSLVICDSVTGDDTTQLDMDDYTLTVKVTKS